MKKDKMITTYDVDIYGQKNVMTTYCDIEAESEKQAEEIALNMFNKLQFEAKVVRYTRTSV